MGGGNGNKAHLKRERNAKKAAQAKKGSGPNQKEAAQKAMTIICMTCRTQFMSTSNEATLRQHQEAKHAKLSFEQCFPNYGE